MDCLVKQGAYQSPRIEIRSHPTRSSLQIHFHALQR